MPTKTSLLIIQSIISNYVFNQIEKDIKSNENKIEEITVLELMRELGEHIWFGRN